MGCTAQHRVCLFTTSAPYTACIVCPLPLQPAASQPPIKTSSQPAATAANPCCSPFPASPQGGPDHDRGTLPSPADSPPAKRRRLASPRRASTAGSRPQVHAQARPTASHDSTTSSTEGLSITSTEGSRPQGHTMFQPGTRYDSTSSSNDEGLPNLTASYDSTSHEDVPSSTSSGDYGSHSRAPSTPIAAPAPVPAASALHTAFIAAPLQPPTTSPTSFASLTRNKEQPATHASVTRPAHDDTDEEETVFFRPGAATPVGSPLPPPSPAYSFSSVSSLCSLPSLTGFTLYEPAQRERKELFLEGPDGAEGQGAPAAVDATAAAAVARVLFAEGQEGAGEGGSQLLQPPQVLPPPPPQQQQHLFGHGPEGPRRQVEQSQAQGGELHQDEVQGLVDWLEECLGHGQEGVQEQEGEQQQQLQGHEVQGMVEWLEECLRVDVGDGARSTVQPAAAGGGAGDRREVAAAAVVTAVAAAGAAGGGAAPLRGRRTDLFAHSNLENDNEFASYFVEEEVVSVDLEDDTEEVAIEPIPVAQGLAAWRRAEEARQQAHRGPGAAGRNPPGQQQGPGAKGLLPGAGHSPAVAAPASPYTGCWLGEAMQRATPSRGRSRWHLSIIGR